MSLVDLIEAGVGILLTLALLIGALWTSVRTRAEARKIRVETEQITAELRPNGGNSMRDQITAITEKLNHLTRSVGGIRDDIRADREADRAALDTAQRQAAADHDDIRRRLGRLETKARRPPWRG